MKRFLSIVLIVVLSLGLFACGKNEEKVEEIKETVEQKAEEVKNEVEEKAEDAKDKVEETAKDVLADLGFVEKDGIREYVELENSPVEGGGLRIQIDKKEGKIHMIKTDPQGQDTKEYVSFFPNKKEVEKYKYVSMMGTGFYYFYNLEKGELVKIEGDDHQDKTESTKSAGRFDAAVEDTKEDVEKLMKYFEDKFGKMEDAIK